MIIQTIEKLESVLDWLELQETVVIDIETTGLSQKYDAIIGFGISSGDTGFYITHLEYRSGELQEKLSKPHCLHLLKQLEGKKLITFNGAFDLPFIKNYFGIDLLDSLWLDALLLKHTLDEEHPF